MPSTEIRHYPNLTAEELRAIFVAKFGDKYEVCKGSLAFDCDIIVKKSEVSGVAVKLQQGEGKTVVHYNSIVPSFSWWSQLIGPIPLIWIGKGIRRDIKQFLETTPELAKAP